jgi:peptidoglycan/xylan/chitin deacetylase (PgdA/CDA1 family)
MPRYSDYPEHTGRRPFFELADPGCASSLEKKPAHGGAPGNASPAGDARWSGRRRTSDRLERVMVATRMKQARAVALTALVAAVMSATAVPRTAFRAAAPTASTPRAMALTFDDLPYADAPSGITDTTTRARRVTGSLLRTLASHQAPAVGFVNEARLGSGREPEARTALLQAWVDGGAVLGNHTYSHPDFNTLTIQQFEDEIVKGEVVTRRLMQSHQPYQLYFRHPRTHTGDTQAKKEAIEQFLSSRGYKVAPHTIDSSDFIFNAGYLRALGTDEVAASRLRGAYVDFVISATEFAEHVSPEIFGRDIPQTMLLHANDLNADSLDDLLKRLEGRGYRFVSLDAAMADPAYRTRDVFVTKSGPTWLWRWMKSRGMSVSFRADPEPPQWVTDLFNRASR